MAPATFYLLPEHSKWEKLEFSTECAVKTIEVAYRIFR